MFTKFILKINNNPIGFYFRIKILKFKWLNNYAN